LQQRAVDLDGIHVDHAIALAEARLHALEHGRVVEAQLAEQRAHDRHRPQGRVAQAQRSVAVDRAHVFQVTGQAQFA
jgi:hypothetical protein